MDSCSSWSPSGHTAEAPSPLGSILPSVSLQETTRRRGFCAMEGKFCASDSDVYIQDTLCSAEKLSHAQEESLAMLSPSKSANCCGFGLTKRPKVEQSGLASKAQMSQNQVRKLGEKISALQQLVSPFGKTDTASVLLEAIGYIKFLQDQVHVLSSPYMKSNGDRKGGEASKDLRRRGLCLVPISCTLNVANNNGADYWISSNSGCSR